MEQASVRAITPVDADDRRNAGRQRMAVPAKIAHGAGRAVVDCTIRDLSDTGAKIELAADDGLPEAFFLHFADGRQAPVEVVWRAGPTLGVRFTGAPGQVEAVTSASIKDGIVAQIEQIEAQLAALRNEVMVHFRE